MVLFDQEHHAQLSASPAIDASSVDTGAPDRVRAVRRCLLGRYPSHAHVHTLPGRQGGRRYQRAAIVVLLLLVGAPVARAQQKPAAPEPETQGFSFFDVLILYGWKFNEPQGHLVLMDRFLRSDSGTLRGVLLDSARMWTQAFARPETFDPRSGAALLLSQTAILSREGVQARALVSEWLTRIDDAEEDKASLWESAIAMQTQLAPCASRARRGGGNVAELVSSLGPDVLAELRADSQLVDAIVLKSTNEQVYLRQLDGLSITLDSMEAALRSN